MEKTFKSALFVVLAALLFGTAFAVDRSGNGLAVANASVPADHTTWTTPVNVTLSGSYDNYPALGVGRNNGAATVFWGRAEENVGLLLQTSNTTLGGTFSPEVVHAGSPSLSGNPEAAGDQLGRRQAP